MYSQMVEEISSGVLTGRIRIPTTGDIRIFFSQLEQSYGPGLIRWLSNSAQGIKAIQRLRELVQSTRSLVAASNPD